MDVGACIRSFRDIIDHLATLTRNDLRYGQAVIPALTEPTPDQRRAFDLIGAPIPLTLSTTQTPQTRAPDANAQLNPNPATSSDVTSA
jgi:hypothetical protein